MTDDSNNPPLCTCGHAKYDHSQGIGSCLCFNNDSCSMTCACQKYIKVKQTPKSKSSETLILTYCKGTNNKHRLVYYHSEANPTSGILTIWHLCLTCNHCIVRHYNPQNSNCSIVTDEPIGLEDDKGNPV